MRVGPKKRENLESQRHCLWDTPWSVGDDEPQSGKVVSAACRDHERKEPPPFMAGGYVSGALTDFLLQDGARVITLIGCGGKTTLLWKLARNAGPGSTLVTTTTHIGRPLPETGLYAHFFDETDVPVAAREGVTLAGKANGPRSLSSFSPDVLERLIPLYQHVFLEGDGSRSLPLKGWADYEPVVPAATDITVGILPLWPLGRPISDEIVHRLPLFLALTGAQEGAPLTTRHITRMIAGWNGKRGLFTAARGKRALFFNQIEEKSGFSAAREVVASLPPAFRADLWAIFAGSAARNRVEKI